MDTKAKDEKYMRMALDEARKALAMQEVPIGAVVVAGDRIVGRGHNLVETLADSTAHAEMQALTDCTIYVTVEPCAMCAGALAWSRVARVVYGAADPKRGYSTFSERLLHPRTELTAGVMEAECRELMEDFFASLR